MRRSESALSLFPLDARTPFDRSNQMSVWWQGRFIPDANGSYSDSGCSCMFASFMDRPPSKLTSDASGESTPSLYRSSRQLWTLNSFGKSSRSYRHSFKEGLTSQRRFEVVEAEPCHVGRRATGLQPSWERASHHRLSPFSLVQVEFRRPSPQVTSFSFTLLVSSQSQASPVSR